ALELPDVGEPDLVVVGARNRGPAKQTRGARHRRRHGGRDDVEPVVRAPRAGGRGAPAADEGANPRIKRVRRAGDPGKAEGWGGDRRLQVRDVVDDAVVPERVARRELQLVAHGPPYGSPRERRRAVE